MMNWLHSRQNEVWWPQNCRKNWVWIFETLTRFLGNTDDWIINLISSSEKEASDVVLLKFWRFGIIIIISFFEVEFQRILKIRNHWKFWKYSIGIKFESDQSLISFMKKKATCSNANTPDFDHCDWFFMFNKLTKILLEKSKILQFFGIISESRHWWLSDIIPKKCKIF